MNVFRNLSSMPDDKAILVALKKFADAVTAKTTTLTVGEPEDQLRGPFEIFMQEVGQALALKVVSTGETMLPGRMGKPDYAVHSNMLLAGYVELKAPGFGANPNRFTGHNKDQWKRFQSIPNLVYCDGNDWGLYRQGERIGPIVRMSGDVSVDGKTAVNLKDAAALMPLLTDFLSWDPIIPSGTKQLAELLAPLCRMLRDDVTDALAAPSSPLVVLAKDWRQWLFPDASNEQFADAYAQTVTFAFLLARSENATTLDIHAAVQALSGEHTLLSKALEVLTDPQAQKEISASLQLLQRITDKIPDNAMSKVKKDPWLYFYEDFMQAYDPKFRKKLGVFYTPVEVVQAQVRLIDDLLTNKLGKSLGFADGDVITLDPAVGTGTYLLAVIKQALGRIEAEQGPGAVAGQASALASQLYGFEIMVGPYAVSELRVSRALQDRGGKLPANGLGVYLTDTLESPHTTPPQLPLYLQPIADQHKRALRVKDKVPVIVCLGNPPYGRHEAVNLDSVNLSRFGGWVRFGDPVDEPKIHKRQAKKKAGTRIRIRDPKAVLKEREKRSILYKAFVESAIAAGHGGDVKNLYNLYVYFWRWALWKVFEHKTASGPGIVSFITAASYLDGDAFAGMREHLRRSCDEVWIIDLGGEGRGTRKSENVFAIQTPVAIAVAVRYGKADKNTPAKVHYVRIDGTRNEKLKALDAVASFASLTWQDCPDDWQAPFRPAGSGEYFNWLLLTDFFPWQQSGVKVGRTWVIAPDLDILKVRWQEICQSSTDDNRREMFKDSPTGRKAHDAPMPLPPETTKEKPILELKSNDSLPRAIQYAYRSFDRHLLIADARLIDRPGPALWQTHSENQVYLTMLLNHPLGFGPALTACADIPDLHHFRGSYGAKEIVPLYRDAQGKEANILPGLLEMLAKAYGRAVTPEDFLAYVYGVLAQPAFTERFADELGTRELRVPLTKDAGLFARVRDVGARLLWLHTYGQRFVPKGKHKGRVPKGKAKCVKAVPGDAANYPEKYEYNDATKTLHVGDPNGAGGEFAPVAPEVYEFEVSGLKVVQSWLGYRMKNPKGRKSSPLDEINPKKWPSEFTTELLELLWVLEATLAEYPAQAKLLSAVVKGSCFQTDELPDVPDAARKPPSRPSGKGLFDKAEDKNE